MGQSQLYCLSRKLWSACSQIVCGTSSAITIVPRKFSVAKSNTEGKHAPPTMAPATSEGISLQVTQPRIQQTETPLVSAQISSANFKAKCLQEKCRPPTLSKSKECATVPSATMAGSRARYCDESMCCPLKGPMGLESSLESVNMPWYASRLTDGVKCPLSNNNIVSNTFCHTGGVLSSNDGIRLTIPKNAIRDGDLVTLYAVVDLHGPFVFPSNSQADLASPYYWIGVSGSYHFQKPVEVEFEHFGACDPSHYQLLTCEDDDDSYNMRPVDYDYDLSFKVQGDILLCNFQTTHCCSYCLKHKNEAKGLNKGKSRIGAFYLKPQNLKSLENSLTIEIWFSFATKLCLNRNSVLFEKRGMKLDDKYLFEASSSKCSRNYFKLSYDQNIYGWRLDPSGATDRTISTKKVNFYNYYSDAKELSSHEECSIYPPRFVVDVRNTEHVPTTTLDTNLTITLYNNRNSQKPLNTIRFKLYIPIPKNSPAISIKNSLLLSVNDHYCYNNKPKFTDLITYSKHIASVWKEIGIYLGVSQEDVSTIDRDYRYLHDKCFAMFTKWLKIQNLPCWCHFIQALWVVELYAVAESVKGHLQLCTDASSNTTVTASTDLDMGECSSKTVSEKDILSLNQFVNYLEDIQGDWKLFVLKLLPHRTAQGVIRDIRRNGGSSTERMLRIGKAFMKQKDPSWTKVHRALKEAKCDDLAETIESCFLPV